ncbi:MAG: hypothetical protein QOH29_2115 [Actinomycetota bacterium]|jgi:hypothetical protein|nr:hypothetical protein [Actinomycetota bacterium]
MPVTALLQSIVGWIRKGYPEGVPQKDYIALLALLKRRVSDREVAQIAAELASVRDDSEASRIISAAIEQLTREPPSPADVDRVRERLRAAGWDLTGDSVPTQ